MFNSTHYMSLALKEAKLAYDKNSIPVGAIIHDADGLIIAKSHNSTKNFSIAHAEINAINIAINQDALGRLDGCSLYTTLEPCMMCAGAIINARISKVYIGTLQDNALYTKNYMDNLKAEVYHGLLEEECREILRDFFNKKRKNQ